MWGRALKEGCLSSPNKSPRFTFVFNIGKSKLMALWPHKASAWSVAVKNSVKTSWGREPFLAQNSLDRPVTARASGSTS